MRNVFEYYKDDDYLAHHGIRGQKWGIRRFQNADGSLTAEGKERYGRALSEGVKKADRLNNASATIQRVHKSLDKNAAVKEFEKTNETAMSLRRARSDIDGLTSRLTKQVHDELEKEFGKPWYKLSGDQQIAYFVEGKKRIQERASKEGADELVKRYDELSQEYEKEAREFLKDLLGKYGNETLKSNWAVKYNFVTKEISKQTITDLAGIEMLRRAGGRI